MKRMNLLFLVVILFFHVTQEAIAQHGPMANTITLNLTPDQWRSDLRYFASEVPKRHKNAFHTITREQFETAVKTLDSNIPKLKNEEVFVEFIRLIAMIGDGHTSINEQNFMAMGLYPVRFETDQEGLYIKFGASEYSEIIGGRVVKIGKMEVKDAWQRLLELSWGDNGNEQSKNGAAALLLTYPTVLHGLKISETNEKVSITVEKDGQEKTLEVKAVTDLANFFRSARIVNAFDESSNPIPLYLNNQNSNFWSEYLKDKKTLYVHINQTQNKPNETMADFAKKTFDFADTNPVDKFVLDLRDNQGGNNVLNKPLVLGLIKGKFNERGKLFVIIGRRTFSAAQLLVNDIEKYTNAIFVGEPTGSSPNLYGDPIVMTLPNSKMAFRVSTLWHQIDPNDRRVFTSPEIFATVSASDHRNNLDPMLQAVMEYVPGTVFRDIAATAANQELTEFIRKYREFKSNPKNKFVNTETDTNALGYRLIQAKRIKDAVEVFKLNAEFYPNSANVFDSLGEAYLLDGNRNEAIKNYEKALKIDPNYRSAAEALSRIKSM
jgi:tetratricopeptide (TPR) repeat protein